MKDIKRRAALKEHRLHGETLKIETAQPSTSLLVMVSSKCENNPIHQEMLEGYFGNPKLTGVSASGSLTVEPYHNKQDMFIVTFTSDAG